MTIRVGINGFGRIGRLALRESFDSTAFKIVHINERAGNVEAAAHLLKFDSIHGTWQKEIDSDANQQKLIIDGVPINYSQCTEIKDTPWLEAQVDLVLECTGQFKTIESLNPFLIRTSKGRCFSTRQRLPGRSSFKRGDGRQ